jgi:hypothetical protein
MLKYNINLQNFDNVAAGKTAKTKADIGPRYHSITLDYQESGSRVNEATMESSIEEIIIKLNTVEQWRISPAKLFDIERAYDPNFSVDNGLIHLNFSNRQINGQLQQEATAIGTLGVNSLEIEVKLASGATSPTFDAYAEVDDVEEAPGLIRKLQAQTLTINATGDFKESLSRRGATYRALHWFETADGDVTNVRFQYEGKNLVNQDSVSLHSMLAKYGYSAESKQIVLPFDKRVIGDAVPSQIEMRNGQLRDAQMRYVLTMGASNNVDIVEDFYATPDA